MEKGPLYREEGDGTVGGKQLNQREVRSRTNKPGGKGEEDEVMSSRNGKSTRSWSRR